MPSQCNGGLSTEQKLPCCSSSPSHESSKIETIDARNLDRETDNRIETRLDSASREQSGHLRQLIDFFLSILSTRQTF